MRETVLRWLPLPVLAAGAVATWALWQGRPLPPASPPPEALPRVEVKVAVSRTLVATVRSHGRVEPRGQIELMSEVSGRVEEVSPLLEPGRFFPAGELLVAIDPHDSQVALEAAEGALARVESEARLADARLRRLQALSTSEVVSSAALEEAQHARDIARASVREAGAARRRAARDLERCSVRAPLAGRVRERSVEVGQLVARGTPLARVYGVDEAEIRLPVLASELAVLDPTNEIEARPPVYVLLRGEYAGRARSWRARIAGSEGEISPGTRTLNLIARIQDPFALGSAGEAQTDSADGRPALTIGQWLTAEITGRVLADVIALPRAALQGPSEVWVVDAANRLRSRPVRVVRAEGEEIWVGDGLSEGDRVVVAAGNLVPGERVRAVERAATAHIAGTGGSSR